ncbi:TonB family protein [Arsukibacterium indicum]|uniref:TonB family protein n=1 Tax=Arsukibacterium indicum TaxID=2848612 RepID=A0ABS6MNV0_9GAMM|nr:TonB family protein [Arsukibacterium indicum]MBV2130245.1 TonB family protein [Arsukibacterium indicum]
MESLKNKSSHRYKFPAAVLLVPLFSTALLWQQAAYATTPVSVPDEPVILERAEPRYPVQAASDGVQGFVELQFNVEADGSTSNIQVIEAKPKRVFEQEAIRALARWKYQPAATDSANQNVVVTIDFSLRSHLAQTLSK